MKIELHLSVQALTQAILGQDHRELRQLRGLLQPLRGVALVSFTPLTHEGVSVTFEFTEKNAGIDTKQFPGY